MICKQCGAQIDNSAAECPFCGTVYEENTVAEKPEVPETTQVPEAEVSTGTESAAIETGENEKPENDFNEEIEEILDENEIKRRRQLEKMRAEKQAQLDEIERRRKLKKRKQARNKAIIAVIIVAVIAGAGVGGYQFWKRHREAPDIVIATPQPVDDLVVSEETPVSQIPESEEQETEAPNWTAAGSGSQTASGSSSGSGVSSGTSSSSGGTSSGSGTSSGTSWKTTSGNSSASASASGNTSSGSSSAASGTISTSQSSFGGKSYSSEGSYKDGKFNAALVTGVEVLQSNGKSYMSFKYNGAIYYAKISADTTTEFVSGRPMTINAFKTSETYNGNDVYEITTITNYSGSYIFPNSGFELLTESDLAGKSAKELLLGRNEIYARHGRKFQNAEIRAYFESCSWYKLKDSYNYDDDSANLNSIEQANVNFIVQYEAKMNK